MDKVLSLTFSLRRERIEKDRRARSLKRGARQKETEGKERLVTRRMQLIKVSLKTHEKLFPFAHYWKQPWAKHFSSTLESQKLWLSSFGWETDLHQPLGKLAPLFLLFCRRAKKEKTQSWRWSCYHWWLQWWRVWNSGEESSETPGECAVSQMYRQSSFTRRKRGLHSYWESKCTSHEQESKTGLRFKCWYWWTTIG